MINKLIAPSLTDPIQPLICTQYAWNDDELIAPPPLDPVQLLFCILYAWHDGELLTQVYIQSKNVCCWFYFFEIAREGGAIAPPLDPSL